MIFILARVPILGPNPKTRVFAGPDFLLQNVCVFAGPEFPPFLLSDTGLKI
jgi:hypothetical protein